MADNFFAQFDAPVSGVGQDRPQPLMGQPADPNYFEKFDKPSPEIDWTDILKSLLSGTAEGAYGIAALPGDVNDLARTAGHAAAEFVTHKKLDMPPSIDQSLMNVATGKPYLAKDGVKLIPTSPELMDRTGFAPYKPKTTLGGYAETVGSFVPGAVSGAGGIRQGVENTLRYALLPGVLSEAAGNETKGTKMEPWARAGGAIVGAGVPARAITPFPSSPERQAAVRTLRDEGVTDLTAGQVTGSKPLRYLESETGGSRAAGMLEHQGEQFTSAALRRIGSAGERATPEVIDQAFNDIGGEFNRLSAGNVLNLDVPFLQDMQAAQLRYAGRVAPPNRAPIIGDYSHEIQNLANAGPIAGETYQSLRSRIGADARSIADPDTAHTLRDLQHALDDAMERSIAVSNPGDLGAFQNVRRLYRNLMVMVPAVTGAGEDAAMGIVSPAKLRQATVGQNRTGYARGQGDFSELARAGEAVMRPLPNSGTASRIASRVVPTAIGTALAHALTGGDYSLMGYGGAAGAIAPTLAGRLALSGPGRAYLGNQIVPRSNVTPLRRAVVGETYATEPDRRAESTNARRALARALAQSSAPR